MIYNPRKYLIHISRPCATMKYPSVWSMIRCSAQIDELWQTLQYVIQFCIIGWKIALVTVSCHYVNFRCSCYLKAVRNSGTTTLRWSHRTQPSPYHVCNTEGIHSDCKDECINYVETVLRGSISQNYDVTSSTELCRMLGTTSPPGARIFIQYTTMGVTKTVDLPKMCCFTVPGIPTTFPNTECVSIGG